MSESLNEEHGLLTDVSAVARQVGFEPDALVLMTNAAVLVNAYDDEAGVFEGIEHRIAATLAEAMNAPRIGRAEFEVAHLGREGVSTRTFTVEDTGVYVDDQRVVVIDLPR